MKIDIDTLVADLQPVKPIRSGGGTLATLGITAVAACMVIAFYGLRPDIVAGHPHPMVMVREGMLLVLGFASLAAVVASARPGVGRGDGMNGIGWALAGAALFPLTTLFLLLTDANIPAEALDIRSGMGCLRISIMSGLAIGGILTLWLRRGAPTALNRIGWFVGLTAGSFGTFAYGLHCSSTTLYFVGIWYAGAILISALVGRLVVPPLIRW